MQAGIINSQEKDFRTGFSYFVEAFDAFQNFDTPNAVLALKYMLLCKIMSSAAEEVGSLIDGMQPSRRCAVASHILTRQEWHKVCRP